MGQNPDVSFQVGPNGVLQGTGNVSLCAQQLALLSVMCFGSIY